MNPELSVLSSDLKALQGAGDVLFIMLGAVMIFAMHAGFAFLELGSVRKKNQVNALVKILTDWSLSTVVYFTIGYPLARGIHFWRPASELAAGHGIDLINFFFFLTFAACIPAIISGGIAERAKFWPQCLAGILFVAFVYPFFEGIIWWGCFGDQFQNFLELKLGAKFHDFAGSVVIHSLGGWIALPAILILGPRYGRWRQGRSQPVPVSSIPWLSLGSWVLAVGWFGFNVMSANDLEGVSGLVAVNSLMAMVGGVLSALLASKNDPGFVHNGALAGLIAICAGSDIVHPVGAFIIGVIAALIFVYGFSLEQERLRIDDVLGVWPLHGIAGSWGGIAAGFFGLKKLGGLGGVTPQAQIVGSMAAIFFALLSSFIVYKVIDLIFGFRLSQENEYQGADLTVHKIGSEPENDIHHI